MNIDIEDLGLLLICAVRYSPGWMTYVPEKVQGIVRANLSEISDTDLTVIERDIREASDRNQLGRPKIDAPGWMELLDEIRAEIERRKNL